MASTAITPNQPVISAAPVSQMERIVILDSLRGIAILGILLMNIPGFAVPVFMIEDLSIRNEFAGINFYVWAVVNGVFEGTMRSIFSMLFGVGMLLFLNRIKKRLDGMLPAECFFRRQLWLLVIAFVDAYFLLWSGDILYSYAICGMLLFAFNRLSSKYLILASAICLLLYTARENVDHLRIVNNIQLGEKALNQKTMDSSYSSKQLSAIAFAKEFKEENRLDTKLKKANEETKLMQGDYAAVPKSFG